MTSETEDGQTSVCSFITSGTDDGQTTGCIVITIGTVDVQTSGFIVITIAQRNHPDYSTEVPSLLILSNQLVLIAVCPVATEPIAMRETGRGVPLFPLFVGLLSINSSDRRVASTSKEIPPKSTGGWKADGRSVPLNPTMKQVECLDAQYSHPWKRTARNFHISPRARACPIYITASSGARNGATAQFLCTLETCAALALRGAVTSFRDIPAFPLLTSCSQPEAQVPAHCTVCFRKSS